MVADIWKVPTPAEWVKGKLIYTKPSVTDYVGIMLDGSGRLVAEEAKSIEDDVLYLSSVKPHQRGFLDRTERAHGIALLTVIGKQGVWSFRWQDVQSRTSITLRANMDMAVTPATYVSRLRLPLRLPPASSPSP